VMAERERLEDVMRASGLTTLVAAGQGS